ncbi:MAG: hypothetical protein [Inoviridae sp.]|nr:MAG: hypothetical protein [Inoviridae sp.]
MMVKIFRFLFVKFGFMNRGVVFLLILVLMIGALFVAVLFCPAVFHIHLARFRLRCIIWMKWPLDSLLSITYWYVIF